MAIPRDDDDGCKWHDRGVTLFAEHLDEELISVMMM